MKFRDKSFMQKVLAISSLAHVNDKEDYTQQDFHDMLKFTTELINKHNPEKEISIVIIDKDKKEHSLNIQEVKDNIFMTRDSQQEALSSDEVQAIRDLVNDGYSKATIAKAFGFSRNTVNKYCK